MAEASPLTTTEARLASVEARLRRFEDVQAIRACMHRYMALCDRLDAATPMDALLDCFAEDAVWAGRGARYGASFGAHQGRAAIGAMLGRYRGSLDGELPQRAPHFAFNAHFLASEQIEPEGDGAMASWLMLQASTFADGRSHLNAARLQLRMARCADGHWRIARFETENLLSRPVSHWHSDAPLPVPASPTPTAHT